MRLGSPQAAVLLVLGAASPAAEPAPLGPAEAIAAVDRSAAGVKGRFEMRVAATGKNSKATFLNSDPDYRAPGNVTFSLSPAIGVILKKRFGAPPEDYLRGKRVVVDGIMEKQMVLNMMYGDPRSFNRFQYTLEVRRVAQIVSIE